MTAESRHNCATRTGSPRDRPNRVGADGPGRASDPSVRAAQGVLGLADKHGPNRLEAACAGAVEVGDPSYRTIKGILAAGTEAQPIIRASGDGGAAAHLHGPEALFADPPAELTPAATGCRLGRRGRRPRGHHEHECRPPAHHVHQDEGTRPVSADEGLRARRSAP